MDISGAPAANRDTGAPGENPQDRSQLTLGTWGEYIPGRVYEQELTEKKRSLFEKPIFTHDHLNCLC
jgi:hypothetical protein